MKMIIVGIQNKKISSFHFLLARDYSTQNSLHVQLSADMEFIYNDLTTNCGFTMSIKRFTNIQEQILNKIYFFSHSLEFLTIKKVDICKFLENTLPDCPDIMFATSDSDPDILHTIKPHKDEVLVFTALSLTLYRLSCGGSLPEDGYRINDRFESFYKGLQDKMGKVDRLYRIDLTPSMVIFKKSLVQEKVLPYVGDGYIYKLISAILDLPIIDEDGNRRISHGIPPVGELARILFNIVIMDIFDRQFPKRLPGISFYRCCHEVFISTRVNDEVVFNEKVGYDLLEEQRLGGITKSSSWIYLVKVTAQSRFF